MDDLERQLGALARSITDEDRRLSAPTPDLFAAIRSELAEKADLADAGADLDDGEVAAASPTVGPALHQTRHRDADSSETTFDSDARRRSRTSSIVDLKAERTRRRGLTLWGVLSAAAALAVIAVSGLYLAGLADTDPGSGTTLASATIANDGLPVASDRTAEANLVDVNGDLHLDVAFDDNGALPADVDGFYEVWLIDENVDGMISLGVLTADGRLDVPDTVDPSAFPVVDISVEPLDGDPTHSGQSVLRGVLSF
jgi:hypothetical protein